MNDVQISLPTTSNEVTFAFLRRAKGSKRYGIVFKINGENTLFRERKPDSLASMWIMEADRKEIVVKGFQIDINERQAFKIANEAESEKRRISYGNNLGLIALSVTVHRVESGSNHE